MKIALFIEGQTDKITFPILVRKILKRKVAIITRVIRRGNLLNKQKVYSHITKDILVEHPDVSKIIVCLDSECTPETEAKANARNLEDFLRSKVNHSVYYSIVIHALEGWLLADSDNIKVHLGPHARVDFSPSDVLNCKPKEVMKRVFRRNGKRFLPMRDYPEIAERIDIYKIAKNNKSFECFRNRVKDP